MRGEESDGEHRMETRIDGNVDCGLVLPSYDLTNIGSIRLRLMMGVV